jgi:hypothetical protein
MWGPSMVMMYLEGFTADAEYLGKPNDDSNNFDRGLYIICKLEICYIFDITVDDQVRIPPLNISPVEHILSHKMKPGKACNIYHLTVKHLRHCGPEAKLSVLELINRVLQDIFFLAWPRSSWDLEHLSIKAKTSQQRNPIPIEGLLSLQYWAP